MDAQSGCCATPSSSAYRPVIPLRNLAWLVALGSLLHLGVATAQESAPELTSESARLTYTAPAGCPTAATFRDQVENRVNRAWEAAPNALAREVAVSVAKGDSDFVAQMRFTDPTGRDVVRTVSGTDCEEVVTGISIVTALAIESLLAPEPPAPPAEPLPPASEPEPETPAPAAKPPAPPIAPPPRDKWLHQVGVGGGLRWGVGPAQALALLASWTTGPRARPTLLGFHLTAADTTRTSAAGVQTRFQLLATRLEGCPLTLRITPRLSVPLCGGMEFGAVRGRGYENPPEIVTERRTVAPWWAITAGPRARLATRSAFVEFLPAIQISLVSWSYELKQPDREAFATPSVAASLATQAGIRFQ